MTKLVDYRVKIHSWWIKFFMNAINEAASLSAQLLMQYEDVISSDEKNFPV